MDLANAEPISLFVVSVVVFVITLAIFYYLIKAAVKNGILEAEAIKQANKG